MGTGSPPVSIFLISLKKPTMANFETFAAKILTLEGGFSDHPADRGGATNMGVTLATWRRIGYDKDGDGDIDPDDLLRINRNDVFRVLRYFYWNRWRADEIENDRLACMLVDWYWCSGKWGIVIPQRILGVVPDGCVGPTTLGAVNHSDPEWLLSQLITRRLRFIDDIISRDPSQKVFEKGWKNRIRQWAIGSRQ